MALSNYNPKILNFLYELTKLKRFMSKKEIADNINLDSGKVSPRTVQRWFSFLRQKYYHPESKTNDKFDYFPTFFYEKLGLIPIYVISEKADEKLLKLSALQHYQDYAAWLYDFSLKGMVMLNGYLVPTDHLEKFKQEWVKIKEQGIVKSYKLYITNKGFNIYSPWHKVIDKHGIFHPERNDEEEIDIQVEQFKHYLNNLPEVKIANEIKKNPLVIPTLFEYSYECWSSYQVWQAIKERLGNNVWNYIKKKSKQSDGVGIKKVQEAINDIHEFNLFHQMRAIYIPLEVNHNFFIYAILKFENQKRLIENLREFAMNSIQMSIYPREGDKIFIIGLVNNKTLSNFLNLMKNMMVERILLLQHEKSLSLLTTKAHKKFDYASSFNPKSLDWA